jgi:hypothetical protein
MPVPMAYGSVVRLVTITVIHVAARARAYPV